MINKTIITGLLISIVLFAGGCTAGEIPEGGETGSIIPFILFLVGIVVIFYFLMIRPQRKRQKEHDSLVHELKKGDRVVTAGGIYGQIESIDQVSVLLKVESGATLRMAKSSIIGRQEHI